MTLTEFLLARIAEGEDRAKMARDEGAAVDVARLPTITFAHVVAWGPDRVLAECEAKRHIVALHSGPQYGRDDEHLCQDAMIEDDRCETTRAIALPYADHPDYDNEWRP